MMRLCGGTPHDFCGPRTRRTCFKKTLLALESAAGCKREALVGTVNERLDYAASSDKWR